MADLDRRIVLRVQASGPGQFGEEVTTTVDHPAWAQLLQDNVARSIEVGGTYGLAARTWRVRFDQRFVTAHEAGQTITVVYGAEDGDVVNALGEPTTRGPQRRRRFLDLST